MNLGMEKKNPKVGSLLRYAFAFSKRLRQKRLEEFVQFLEQSSLEPPIKILDVGGTESFWKSCGVLKETKVLLLNLEKIEVTEPTITSEVGDARNLKKFQDNEFDLVFSNSVIEHVGGFEDQKRMAIELQRVGKAIYLQTPNYFFPVEPHFFYPCFQFMPLKLQLFIGTHFDIGWFKHIKGEEKKRLIASTKLLSERDLRRLFPQSRISKEKVAGLTKSFIVREGF